MNEVHIQLKGTVWAVRTWTTKSYTKKFGKDSKAITISERQEIHFDKTCLSLGVIRHELMHALLSETHTESAGLTATQIEEIACSLMETQFYNLATISEYLLNRFIEVKQELEVHP